MQKGLTLVHLKHLLSRKYRWNSRLRKHNNINSSCEANCLTESYERKGTSFNILQLHSNQLIFLRKYFAKKYEQSVLHQAVVRTDNNYTHLDYNLPLMELQTAEPRDIDVLEARKRKAHHGRHPHELSQENVDRGTSNYWLIMGISFWKQRVFL